MKNLIKRGNVYYLSARVNRERISKSLETGDEREAASRARVLLAAARQEKWDVIRDARLRKPEVGTIPTVKEFCDLFLEVAKDRALRFGKPKESTARYYVGTFRGVLARVYPDADVDALKMSVVDAELATKYAAATLATVDASDEMLMDRARGSVASALRQVKALFSVWALEACRRIKLPDVKSFMNARPCKVQRTHKYRLPPQDLRDKTMAAGRALRKSNVDLSAVFLLCYDLGLRANEAASCKWEWFREVTNGRKHLYVDIIKRPDWRPKGNERSVPVAGSVWEQLIEARRPGDDYVLAGGSPSAREDLIKRVFAKWMRDLGWHKREYPKAAHELRKLIGSEWYTRFGAEVACSWLGHADITTTFKYYADLKRHPDPIEIE